MDNETLEHLLALREVNKALTEGLKTAIFVLERIEELNPERRKAMIESLKGLISQSEIIYGETPTKH